MIITVTFTDTLSRKAVYSLSTDVKANTERARCKLLNAAYAVAGAKGINLADGFVAHRFS